MTTFPDVTRVEEIMITDIITVSDTDKMDEVARVFKASCINFAPVLNQSEVCVGVITSHDIARYEATRAEVENEFKHGYFFDRARYGDGTGADIPRLRFDDVGVHMTKSLEVANLDDPLARVARKMCDEHIHHVVILDREQRLIGMLSALDVLSHIFDTPIGRKTRPGETLQ